MVRIRIGGGWRDDPDLRRALAGSGAVAEEAARAAAAAIAVEVDGVDLAAGRAEGPLLPSLADLADAAARLVAGTLRAEVHLADGALDLLLRRRGTSALLTVVALARPSRVLARDVEVDLPALAAAVREAGESLLGDLIALGPGASRSAAAVSLRRALACLAAARPAEVAPPPPGTSPSPRRRAAAARVACAFEIRDEEGLLASYRGPGADLGSLLAPGRVALRAPGAGEILALEGIPFLLLRDLAAFAARIAAAAGAGEGRAAGLLAPAARGQGIALEVDLQRGTFAAGRRAPLPVDPLSLARGLLEGALDFCGAVAARNPWQAENGYLAELRRSAAEALAHAVEWAGGDRASAPRPGVRAERPARPPRRPLGPGRLRRLAWRRIWTADVGAPAGEGLFPAGDLVVAAGAAAVLGIEPADGRVRWRAPGATWAAMAGHSLLLASGARVARREPRTGREAWARSAPGGAPRALLRLRGGPLLLAAADGIAALEPASGGLLWRFEPPGASGLVAASLGALAAVASAGGLAYGLGPDGLPTWRLRLPGPPAAPPVPWGGLCALACATPVGGALLAFDPATGQRAWETPLDFAPGGTPLPFAGLLAVPGAVAGDPVVGAVEPDGRVAWTAAPPLGRGPPSLAAAGALLLVRGGDGACAALGRDAWVRWAAPAAADPAGPPLPPAAARGVVLLPGDPVRALGLASGDPLGTAPLPPPARLLVDGELGLTAMDADGFVAGARLARRLGVVG